MITLFYLIILAVWQREFFCLHSLFEESLRDRLSVVIENQKHDKTVFDLVHLNRIGLTLNLEKF